MITFYNSVQDAGEEDFLPVATAISYYESEFGEALKDLTPKGTIWDLSKKFQVSWLFGTRKCKT